MILTTASCPPVGREIGIQVGSATHMMSISKSRPCAAGVCMCVDISFVSICLSTYLKISLSMYAMHAMHVTHVNVMYCDEV